MEPRLRNALHSPLFFRPLTTAHGVYHSQMCDSVHTSSASVDAHIQRCWGLLTLDASKTIVRGRGALQNLEWREHLAPILK